MEKIPRSNGADREPFIWVSRRNDGASMVKAQVRITRWANGGNNLLSFRDVDNRRSIHRKAACVIYVCADSSQSNLEGWQARIEEPDEAPSLVRQPTCTQKDASDAVFRAGETRVYADNCTPARAARLITASK